jgi:hypothetical protein
MVERRRDQLMGDFTRKARLVVAAALTSVLLAACGGDSDSPAAAAAPSTSTSAPAAPVAVSSAKGAATLSWTPPTENDDGSPLRLTAYRVYWGNARGNYPHSVTLDNPGLSRYVVDQLSPATWYFVVTAMSADGESIPSNEIAVTVL